jgi:hypothetical protein
MIPASGEKKLPIDAGIKYATFSTVRSILD